MIKPPVTIPLSEILPKEPLLLMGAGPVPIPDSVSKANGVVINHIGETMDKVIARVKLMAGYAFQTNSPHILGISGPSSAAMEMAVTSLLWPSRSVLVLKNGTFSARFEELASGIGASVTCLESIGHTPFTLEQVKAAVAKNKVDVITIVQGETSCGVYNKNLKEISLYCKSIGVLVIVDAVCTLTTMPLYMDEWGIDIAVTGGQKGLSSIPGVSLIAFSQTAWDVIEKRTAPIPQWVLNPLKAARFWHHQEYHYTAPVPGILALHEALRIVCEETLESRFERHYQSSQELQKSLQKMGLELYNKEEDRLNSVVAIKLPDNIDSLKLRKYMIQHHSVEISGAFGLPIIRIGQMGEQCQPENVLRTLEALKNALIDQGYKLKD